MTIALHHNVKDLTDRRIARWTVLRYVGNSYWHCRCVCGTERKVFTGNLDGKKSKSCGCHRTEVITAMKTTHGLSKRPEYKTWAGIKRRCLNRNDRAYQRYGAKGVTICRRWRDSFPAFFADMGPKPTPAHTIDRIKNSKGYKPGNCRWALGPDQNRNKGDNRPITLDGRTQTLAEWSRERGLHHSVIQFRLRAGWSVERALMTRARPMKRRR